MASIQITLLTLTVKHTSVCSEINTAPPKETALFETGSSLPNKVRLRSTAWINQTTPLMFQDSMMSEVLPSKTDSMFKITHHVSLGSLIIVIIFRD